MITTDSTALIKEEKLKLQGLKFDSSERSRIKYFLYNIFYIEPEKSQFETYNPLAALNNGNLTQIISKLKIKSSDKTLSTFILPPFEIMTALFMEVLLRKLKPANIKQLA